MTNPSATGKYYWTKPNPKADAVQAVELVRPDGTLAGLTLRTLINGWGQYQDRQRDDIERRILALLNGEQTS